MTYCHEYPLDDAIQCLDQVLDVLPVDREHEHHVVQEVHEPGVLVRRAADVVARPVLAGGGVDESAVLSHRLVDATFLGFEQEVLQQMADARQTGGFVDRARAHHDGDREGVASPFGIDHLVFPSARMRLQRSCSQS